MRNYYDDHDLIEDLDNLSGFDHLPSIKNMPGNGKSRIRKHHPGSKTRQAKDKISAKLIEHEYKTMQVLHAAGANIPVPYARGDNAILMAFIGGPDMAAPTLNTIDLPQEEAQVLFTRVLKNVDLILSVDRVHGDLSAYNLLYWEGEPAIIDFPQAISPNRNRNAFMIFERDIILVCEYFAIQGIQADARSIAAGLWTAHNHRLTPSDVNLRLLDPEDKDDFAYWEKYLKEKLTGDIHP